MHSRLQRIGPDNNFVIWCKRVFTIAGSDGACAGGLATPRQAATAATVELTIASQLLRHCRRSFSQTVETISLQTRMAIDVSGRPADLK
jgi:hypothetical protein